MNNLFKKIISCLYKKYCCDTNSKDPGNGIISADIVNMPPIEQNFNGNKKKHNDLPKKINNNYDESSIAYHQDALGSTKENLRNKIINDIIHIQRKLSNASDSLEKRKLPNKIFPLDMIISIDRDLQKYILFSEITRTLNEVSNHGKQR